MLEWLITNLHFENNMIKKHTANKKYYKFNLKKKTCNQPAKIWTKIKNPKSMIEKLNITLNELRSSYFSTFRKLNIDELQQLISRKCKENC